MIVLNGDQSAVLLQGSLQVELGEPGEEDRPGGRGFVVVRPGHQFSRLQAPRLPVDQGPWFWPVSIGIPNTQPELWRHPCQWLSHRISVSSPA